MIVGRELYTVGPAYLKYLEFMEVLLKFREIREGSFC